MIVSRIEGQHRVKHETKSGSRILLSKHGFQSSVVADRLLNILDVVAPFVSPGFNASRAIILPDFFLRSVVVRPTYKLDLTASHHAGHWPASHFVKRLPYPPRPTFLPPIMWAVSHVDSMCCRAMWRSLGIDVAWHGVCREATALLQDMLQVEDVWFLSQGHQASQEFVQWAGKVLQHR